MRIATIRSTWFALFLVSGTAAGAGIDWHHWDIGAFETARTQNKIILVNVGMEGCAACARMESITYTDPGVIDLVDEHFIAIEVDAEARPDIGERYSDWAWPATIFMAPDATQVLAIRGNRLPRNFIPILEEMAARHDAGTLDARSHLRVPLGAPGTSRWVKARQNPAEASGENRREDLLEGAQRQQVVAAQHRV